MAFRTEGCARKGVVTLPAQEVSSVGGHHPLGKSLGMVSTQQQAMSSAVSRMDVVPMKTCSHPGFRLQGVPETFTDMDGSSENSCVRCDQVDGLLNRVAELREEVERLRSSRELEKERDW